MMLVELRKSAVLGLAVLGCSGAWATAAKADPYPYLPGLTNLDFEQYTGSAPKGSFSSVAPVGWTGGTGLIFIDGPTEAQSAAGPVYLQTYGNPQGSVPGNYVEADGNPEYGSGFNYQVTGLTPGQTYTLSFYQGASAQTGFGYDSSTGTYMPTTNQWIVSLGTSGLQIKGGGPTDPVYGSTDLYYNNDANASIVASPLMSVPYQDTVGWNYVQVNLTADSTTDLLSFLAWGDNGSTVNLPPIAFLSGINSPDGLGAPVPEPATLSLIGVGLTGLTAVVRRRRGKRMA